MGLRYRKSISLLPGVRLNIGLHGLSLSFGKKGVHYTVSSNGKRTASVGIPGSGLSYRTTSKKGSHPWLVFLLVALLVAVAALAWLLLREKGLDLAALLSSFSSSSR